jgi:integrase
MTAEVLTARFVEAAKPKRNGTGKAVRTEYPDAACLGLRLIVQPTGTKAYALRYRRPGGTSAKHTIGDASKVTLAAARHAAAAARHRLEQGIDPAPRHRTDPVTASTVAITSTLAGGDSIGVAVASFLEKHAYRKNRRSTARAAERIFNRLVLAAWRDRSIQSIARRDVIALVEDIATDRPYLANRTLGVLSKFFNWLCSRDVLAASPAHGVERPHKEQVRNRTLSDSELRALWRACEGEGPFGQAMRLLVLTGARRNEVSQMKWDELSGDNQRLWTIPQERSKNKQEHVVPLSSQAWAIIKSIPHLAGCDYVFSANGRKPVTGWAKAKTRLSAKADIPEKNWRLHDLRRTCASGMQRLGITIPVVERALNHKSGVFRGIVSTYQTHDYADEVRAALQRWADHVEQLVTGKSAKVIPCRSAQA